MDSIEQTRLYVFSRDGWKCRHCGKLIIDWTPQVAHLIPQRKKYIEKYGKEIIHHPDNMKSACSLACNNAMSIYGKDLLIDSLVFTIKQKLAIK